MEPETASGGGFAEERHEKEEMQRRVREMLERIGKESGWWVVDAGKQKDTCMKISGDM